MTAAAAVVVVLGLCALCVVHGLQLRLYDVPVSNHGARVRMLVKAKGLDKSGVVEVVAPSEIGGLKGAEYLALNPQGKMPLLVILDQQSYPVAESDTICRLLVEQFAASGPSFVPSSLPLRTLSDQICRAHDQYVTPLQGAMYKAPGTPFSTFGLDRKAALSELLRQLEGIEILLQLFDKCHGPNERRGGYLCGKEISLADATLFPTMVFAHFILPKFFDVPVVPGGKILNAWFRDLSQNDEAAASVRAEIEEALRGWESTGRWGPIVEEMKKGAPWRWQPLVAAALLTISTDLSPPFQPFQPEHRDWAVVADSTGKMSTKLTARKRYLPRIIEGQSELKAVLANPASPSASEFLSSPDGKGSSLVRAMRLYGASLRRGEVPDEISRKANELSDDFAAALLKVQKTPTPDTAAAASAALQAYLDFANVK